MGDLLPVEWPTPTPVDDLSPGARRTQRQHQAVKDGRNPLRGSLHPNAAPEICTPHTPLGQPYTCGSCRFRLVVPYHNQAYPKCARDWMLTEQGGPYVSHSAATDVRAWWPACALYEPGDPGLSRDAARSLPGGDHG